MQKCKAAVLHFFTFALSIGRASTTGNAKWQKSLNTQEHKLCTFPLFLVQLAWARRGCGGWHKQHLQKCICTFALSAGTAGMGKERVVWLAQVENAKMQKCIFALSAGMAGMGVKDGVISTNPICKSTKVQFFAFLHFRLSWLALWNWWHANGTHKNIHFALGWCG